MIHAAAAMQRHEYCIEFLDKICQPLINLRQLVMAPLLTLLRANRLFTASLILTPYLVCTVTSYLINDFRGVTFGPAVLEPHPAINNDARFSRSPYSACKWVTQYFTAAGFKYSNGETRVMRHCATCGVGNEMS